MLKWTLIALALLVLPAGCAINGRPAKDPMPAFS
jgi:hypothetical protein